MNDRGKWCDSLFGQVRFERPYYHCCHCHSGHVPLDKTLGLSSSHLTPAAAEVASIAGLQASFAQASEVTLKKLCGLKLSESTVERITESVGARLAQRLAKQVTFGARERWAWQRDARGRSCAYVGADATGVRQQAAHGARADGRMAYVAKLYNPNSPHDERRPEPHQARYLAGFYELSELGRQLRTQAAQIGWDEADEQIALSDGGAGLEEFFRVHFPRATRILDFWHAKEHLVELADAWFADDALARADWLDDECHRLKHSGGAAVLAMLEALDESDRTPQAREALRVHTQYFRNHHERMKYPEYLARGWQIGSGPVESACQTVVANRLKGSGMRWGEPGSDAVCHLRALYLSQPNQWEAFWKTHPN